MTTDELNILIIGANYYFRQHNAKLTLDLIYTFDPVPVANAGQGLLASPQGDQMVIRSQLTFSF